MVGWRLWWRRIGLGLAIGLAVVTAGVPVADVASAEEEWVQTHIRTELWSDPGPDAVSFGPVRPFSYFRLHSEQIGDRFYVYNPRSQNFAYIDASALGPSTAPPAEYLMRPYVLETLDVPARNVGTTGVYREPIQDEAVWSHDIHHNAPVMVRDKVEGDDGEVWYRLEDGTFVTEKDLRLPTPNVMLPGRWIDVSLKQPTIVTAYEDGMAVYSALAITGIGGWETPPGSYVIQSRVANERMRGPGWDVSNVLFTQYFTSAGHAIHYNYWSNVWGYQGSRGCLGMNYADSLWFWEWATIGTPIVIHW